MKQLKTHLKLVPLIDNNFILPKITIDYKIKDSTLKINYNLISNFSEIIFEGQMARKRSDKLWEKSCFELFLMQEDGQYFEINLASSLQYNIFSFNSYRTDKKETDDIILLKNNFKKEQNSISMSATIHFNKFSFNKINICVILFSKQNHQYFYSIKPLNNLDQPDFHNSKYFINL